MSLFSRRSMMILAGCALTLPLAAGTANAAFEITGDGAAAADEVSASAEGTLSSAGGSVNSAPADGSACATGTQRCAALRGTGVPELSANEAPVAGRLAAEAEGVVSRHGIGVAGSLRVVDERLGGSAELSTKGGKLSVDTPLGNGATDLETESIDIVVD